MAQVMRDFQVFAKPGGPACNLDCAYCYYLAKSRLYPDPGPRRMPQDLLEDYIRQHIRAWAGKVINFSWHGGEPTLLGLDYFCQIVVLQKKHCPKNKRISNAMQSNGTLLDEAWGAFLAREGFAVGLSLDGPAYLHDRFRQTRGGGPTHAKVMQGYRLLQRHRVPTDILCVVNAENVRHPLEVYRYFKEIGARYIGFLPLVERQAGAPGGVSPRSVEPLAFGEFLCAVFDEWVAQDIGRVKVQIFEEATRSAFGQEHSLCIFRPVCGDIPVLEHNGDFYSCDHFVDPEHLLGNIKERSLGELLQDPRQLAFGRAKRDSLPACCRSCEVLSMCHGECPKNRFAISPQGEPGLNYLCQGYKRFFRHCQPFVRAVAAQWSQERAGANGQAKPGRNQPCPCGSGRKYKQCCMRRG